MAVFAIIFQCLVTLLCAGEIAAGGQPDLDEVVTHQAVANHTELKIGA